MNPKRKAQANVVLGIVILALCAWGAWSVAKASYTALRALDPNIAAAIIAGSTTILAAVLALVIGRHYESKKEREAAHREKKVILYDEFTQRLFRLFHEANTEGENGDMVAFLREIQRKLIMWSGPKVVIAFAKWHKTLADKGGNAKAAAMVGMVDFLLALREDLGHSNDGISTDHVLRFLLKNPDLFMMMYKRNPDVLLAEIAAAEKQLDRNNGI